MQPRYLGVIVLLATLVRLGLGLAFFGFHTGDDLEILQAGLMRAQGWPYQPWEIRNLFVSDVFVAPVARLAAGLGVSSMRSLAWIATWPFVALASLNIWLVYRLAFKWLAAAPPALLAAGLYAFHWIPLGYGSTVYPRTAAVSCILLAVLLVWERRRPWTPFLAGGLIAVAFAVRYSEGIFLLPLLALVWLREEDSRRRVLHGFYVVAGFAAVSFVTVGVEDWLTWGRPFTSLAAFARYTLVEHRASALSPLQSWYWYLKRLPKWLPLTLLPFLWCARKIAGALPIALFLGLPLVVLSAIHHKELRYLQGLVPFLMILAAAGAWSLWMSGRRREVIALTALSLLLGLTGLTFLPRKSMAAVVAAQRIASASTRPGTICLSQSWAYGGPLYLGRGADVVDLPYPLAAADLAGGALARCSWLGLYEEDLLRDARIAALLEREGYVSFGELRWGSSKAVRVFRRDRLPSTVYPFSA